MFALGPARIPQGQQFPQGARINGAHPLAQALGFLGVAQGQLAYDLVGGTAATLTGALTQKTVSTGQALAFPGNSTNRLTWPTQTSTSWKNANDWTLCILGRMLEADYASSNLYPVLVKHTSGSSDLSVGFEDVSGDMRFSIQVDATGLSQPGAVSIGTAGGTNSLGIAGAQTALYTWRLTGTTLDCFVNGALIESRTITAHGLNVAAAIATANTGDAIGAAGAIQAWYVYNRRLDQNEIAQLSAFPWCMFANVAAPDPYLFDGGSSGTNVALTGQAATSAGGTLAPAADTALTGQAATASVGNLGPSQSIAGQAATASVGTLVPTESVALTGSQATVSVGSLAAANAEALSGQAATTGQGTQTPVFNVPLSGQQITASFGTLSVLGDATAALTGTALTMSLGNLGAQNDGIVAQAQQLGGLGEWHHRKHREPSIEEWAEFAEYRDALRQARKELEKPQPSVAKVERAIEVLVTPTFEVPEYETRLEDLRNLAEVAEISRRFQRIVGEYLAMLQDEEDVEILLH